MKRSHAILLVISCVLACGAQEASRPDYDNAFPIPPGCYKAGDFLDLSFETQRAYAAGFVNGLFASLSLGADNSAVSALAHCTEGMSDDEVAEIIGKYIKERPDAWDLELNAESINAIARWCPKLKTKPGQKLSVKPTHN
jgi:hypothetical protein